MYTYTLRVALAALVVLLPASSEAQSQSTAVRPRPERAQAVVGELLLHSQQLALTGGQVHYLTAIATRIREGRGRLQIVGSDRVPGKWVPRLARVYLMRREARGMALHLLTPDQRVEAERILGERKLEKMAAR